MTQPVDEPSTRSPRADTVLLRAAAHPTRLRILTRLRTKGPATVSALAEELDEAIGSISHHVKQLAGAHLAVEDPSLARDGRERWWKAVDIDLSWSLGTTGGNSETADAAFAAQAALATLQTQEYANFLEEAKDGIWSDDWMDAAANSYFELPLTPDQLRALHRELLRCVDKARRGAARASGQDADGRVVAIQLRGFPRRA